jgi:hypothetical protein
MRFESKKSKENTNKRSCKFGTQVTNVGTEAKVLFKLCEEGKLKEFKSLVNSMQERGTIGTWINQPDLSDEDGNTLLHFAVQIENLEIVDLLLNVGANASIKNSRSETPAHTACRAGNLEILKFLVENGGLHGILDDLIIRSRYF